MVVKIHGMAMSTCTQRVAIALREKNVPFEIVPIDFAKGQHKGPEHLKIQPFGQVPVMEDDGFFLFESRAIVRYIANKYKDQGTRLIPTDVKGAALVEQWASVEVADFDPYASAIVFEKVFKGMFGLGEADESKVKELRSKLDEKLDVYEKILSTRSYLAGEEVSFADLFHLPYGSLLTPAGHGDAIASRPNVKAWFDRLSARQSWKETQAAAQQ
ncbi:glutathione S-transferase-like protein [Powellomyces hirtus]|nr:glutathione S-transferase-like protein [Powellomyces hirtus]